MNDMGNMNESPKHNIEWKKLYIKEYIKDASVYKYKTG